MLFGSCICNFLLVIGLAAIIRPIKVDKRISRIHIPLVTIAMIILFLVGNITFSGEAFEISKAEGIALLIIVGLYILYTIYEENVIKKQEETATEEIKTISIGKTIFYILLGIVGLKYGADLVVDNSTLIAQSLGLSERIISMTIIAIGTALPEIVTSIIASVQGESDLVLGNVTGSNLINLGLLIGLGAVIHPLSYDIVFNQNIILLMLIAAIISILAYMDKENAINRRKGILLLLIYTFYITKLFA